MSKIKTDCSGCRIDVTIDTVEGTVKALVPSNGVRGQGHIPAHYVESDLYGDDELLQWECPACEYPDSFDTTA